MKMIDHAHKSEEIHIVPFQGNSKLLEEDFSVVVVGKYPLPFIAATRDMIICVPVFVSLMVWPWVPLVNFL